MGRILEKEVMNTVEESAAYDELESLYGEILFQGFALAASRLGVSSGKVLDVGCGPGRISIRLAKINPALRIQGVDLSESMLARAKKNAEAQGVDGRVEFAVGDAKKLPFPDASFDLVVCHNMLHQLPDPEVCLAEIKRVVKPGGAILVRDVRRFSPLLMRILLLFWCFRQGRLLQRLTRDSYWAGLSLAEFRKVMKTCALEGARVRTHFLTHMSIERRAKEAQHATTVAPDASGWLHKILRRAYV